MPPIITTLPDHQVERIVSMMPFPSIFQARCLSVSWNARFKSVNSQIGEEKKRALLFQNLVSKSCWKWKTISPVVIGLKGDLVAYDRDSNKWRKLPSVAFLPEHVRRQRIVQIEGALLYASNTPSQAHNGLFVVANIFTRTWKCLPGLPVLHCVINSSKLVIYDGASPAYKLILLGQHTLSYNDIHLVIIYDSVLQEWTQKKIAEGNNTLKYKFCLNSVAMRGVVYTGSSYSPPDLCAYNLGEGTFWMLALTVYDRLGRPDLDGAERWRQYQDDLNRYHLVVCMEQFFMLVGIEGKHEKVMKVDVEAMKLVELGEVPTHCPLIMHSGINAPSLMAPVEDGRHIWFGYEDCLLDHQYIRALNVVEGLWSNSFALPGVNGGYAWLASMRPGLSPFLSPFVESMGPIRVWRMI